MGITGEALITGTERAKLAAVSQTQLAQVANAQLALAERKYFVNAAGNPTIDGGAEASMEMAVDAVTCDRWYRLVSQHDIYYQYANNALLTNWTAGADTGLNGLFPTVKRDPATGTYYMVLGDEPSPGQAYSHNLYLYKLASNGNKQTGWTIANGGNPIFTADTSASRNLDFYVANVGLVIVAGVLRMLIEMGGASSPATAYGHSQHLIYRQAPLADELSGAINLSLTIAGTRTAIRPVLQLSANADMHHVPARNAVIAIVCDESPTALNKPAGNGLDLRARFKVVMGLLDSDLSKPDNWFISDKVFAAQNAATAFADAAMVFTPGKTNPAMLYYNYAQSTARLAYLPFADVTAFFDAFFEWFPAAGDENDGIFLARRDRYKHYANLHAAQIFYESIWSLSGRNQTYIGGGIDETHNVSMAYIYDGANHANDYALIAPIDNAVPIWMGGDGTAQHVRIPTLEIRGWAGSAIRIFSRADTNAVAADLYSPAVGMVSIWDYAAGNDVIQLTSTGIQYLGTLPTADPHVAGKLFRTGTALQISVG